MKGIEEFFDDEDYLFVSVLCYFKKDKVFVNDLFGYVNGNGSINGNVFEVLIFFVNDYDKNKKFVVELDNFVFNCKFSIVKWLIELLEDDDDDDVIVVKIVMVW